MTRPTLTGTPDAVPTVELEELLEGGDLEVIDRWLAQADVVEIADELSGSRVSSAPSPSACSRAIGP